MTPRSVVPNQSHVGGASQDALFDMRHLDSTSRPVNILFLLALTILGLMACLVYWAGYGDRFSDTALALFCGLHFVVTACVFGSKLVRRGPRNWLSPDIVFWIVYTMFHIPYVVFYLVGLADYSKKVFFSVDAANRSLCCVILCGIGFLIGYELGPLGRMQPAVFRPARRISSAVFVGAQTLFFMTLAAAVFAIVLGLGGAILEFGYSGFRRIERFVGPESKRWIGLSVMFVRIGVTVYLASCILRYRKIVQGFLLPSLLAGALLFFLLLGARTEVAVALLPIIVGYHYFVKPLKLRLGIPLFLFLLISFGVIGIGRKAETLSPAGIYRAYQEYREDVGVDPFVASLAESGASLKTVNVACAHIPETEPYWKGRSFFDAILMIIPNPVPGLRSLIAPSTWATLVATGRAGGERSGWGASIAMEAYMNFGLFGGGVMMAALGFLVRRIYDTTLRNPTFLRVCLLLVVITSLAMWCRNHSQHFIRPVAWTFLAAWLTQSVFGGARESVAQTTTRGRSGVSTI